jgi:CheY-like chemotaxis protein
MNLQPYHVLIATDYAPVGALLQRVIVGIHPTASLTVCSDGSMALRSYQARRADLIFADHNLPAFNGLTLVRAIREHDPFVPIVVMSVDPRRRLQSLSMGASHFLVKPFALETIEQLVGEFLPLRRERAVGGRG